MSVLLNPYINFNDQAEAALTFYKSVFGGETEISRFAEFPDLPMPVPEDQKNLVMHGVLKSGDLQIMAADSKPMGEVKVGNNITISLSGDDETKLKKYWEGLTDGGAITMPMNVAPWGDQFGMLTDKFGINWLVNITAAK